MSKFMPCDEGCTRNVLVKSTSTFDNVLVTSTSTFGFPKIVLVTSTSTSTCVLEYKSTRVQSTSEQFLVIHALHTGRLYLHC